MAFLSPEGGLSDEDRALVQRPLERARISGVQVVPPKGYCIDRRSRSAGFALVFPCATLTRDPVADNLTNGAVRITIGPALGAGFDSSALEGSLDTSPGRAALSRSGRAEDVTLLRTISRAGVVYAQIEDRGENPLGAGQTAEWRAITSIGGRLVSLAVSGYGEIDLDGDAGLALLERCLVSMAQANRAPAGGGGALSDLLGAITR